MHDESQPEEEMTESLVLLSELLDYLLILVKVLQSKYCENIHLTIDKCSW